MSKSILITGSTDGIGKLAAIKLAKDGHQLYLHGRSEEKLDKVISEIKTLSNNENIKGFVADFSDLADVKKMAAEVKEDISKLDILINNAGIFTSPILKTKDGLDIRFAVNYFAPFILTKALLPLLQKGSTPRIINLSSAAQAPVSLDALSGQGEIPAQSSYAQSKLALTMWSFDLAKNEPGIEVVAVNPGSLLNTNMVREAYGKHWSSADKGANILYDLAISTEYEGASGKYFDNDKGEVKGTFGDAHPDAYNQNAIKRLIEVTESIM
ncbi:SDR family NAD(P)-dependent oxidoreductase [Arcticibacterium luteifluviistationis]|uniref:Short-chain dehydrogenase n=1 Tax=Arcticibacterium luteifluviistationis TaxID=1784714 RepID=A0A2Z4G7R9_9BACT|nr:SDR family NAD(P)-dependent oxidoreductase [Arcticibacterium luteifluviistationis]AWV97150.1 short-chain dehydrogenase [Arcticibacterium luteifluviistationis]